MNQLSHTVPYISRIDAPDDPTEGGTRTRYSTRDLAIIAVNGTPRGIDRYREARDHHDAPPADLYPRPMTSVDAADHIQHLATASAPGLPIHGRRNRRRIRSFIAWYIARLWRGHP